MSSVLGFPPSSNVPLPLTPLIGREHEVAAAAAYLCGDVRLLTLTGVAGVGKTRLAIATAAALADTFEHGVVFVPLASVHDPELVISAVADALAIRDDGTCPLFDRLVGEIHQKHLLLVLDNFEQVVDAAPEMSHLLTLCPNVSALVTSRVRLRVGGEHHLSVPPLPVPDPIRLPSIDRLGRNPSVALFIGRAAAVDHGFALRPENAVAIARVCSQLEGLPLAIELAAARLETLSPAALAARLDGRLAVLTRGPCDAAQRHRTLRDAIGWSYALLSPEEQRVFRGLAVFVGGCDAAAAEAVIGPCIPGAADAVLNGLGRLLEHSLIQRTIGTGEPRFLMLESIREYGLEQLAAHGEEEELRHRLAAHCLALASATDSSVSFESEAWLDQLERDHDNLRAALGWTIANDPAQALRLASALWQFWAVRGHVSEGRSWFARALAAGPVAPDVRGHALVWASHLAFLQADYDHAVRLAEESLSLWRPGEDDSGRSRALCVLGNVAAACEDFASATQFFEEALSFFRASGDQAEIAGILGNLGLVAGFRGDHARAAALFEEAIALSEATGDQRAAAIFLLSLGEVMRVQGDETRAARFLADALQRFRCLGETSTAIAECWEGLAGIAAGTDTVRAARLLGAADALRERLDSALEPALQSRHDATLSAVRSALDSTVFAAAWQAGRQLSIAQASAEALAAADLPQLGEDLPRRRSGATSHGLTSRELEVLRLLAAGRSDREIATALFISRYTAMVHTKNIRRKLGVDSRAAIASYAVRMGLA